MAEAQAGNVLDLWGLQPPLCGHELFWYCSELVTIFHMFFSNHSGVTQPFSFSKPWRTGEFQGQGVFLLFLYSPLPKSK